MRMDVLLVGAATLAVSCSRGPAAPESVVPADYDTAFVEVRDCRPTIEHSAVSFDGTAVDYIRVLANDVAADGYRSDLNPLPEGSVLVKEGYIGTDCAQNGTLTVITAMRKESPGFDTMDGDWHWQGLSPDLRVLDDTKATCIACHREPECLARDYACTVP